MSTNRVEKINEEVKREVSVIIRELKDPRISVMTSVIAVNITKDLKFGKIYVSVMGDAKDTMVALKSASGFIRRELGKRMDIRYTPELTFVLDDSILQSIHISEVINNSKVGESSDGELS